MVDVSHLEEASTLFSEAQTIAGAIAAIDAGQSITMMMIGGASVPTTSLTHPPAMLAAIRGQLDARLNQVKARLAQLGITGDIPTEIAPPPEPPPKPPTTEPEPEPESEGAA